MAGRYHTAEEIVREIAMNSDSEDGECLSDNDPDYHESDSESEDQDLDLDLSAPVNLANGDARPRPSGSRAGDGGRGRGDGDAEWTKEDRRPAVPPFTALRGVQVHIPQGSTPLDYFALLANDEFFDLLVTETNRYAAQVKEGAVPNYYVNDWEPVTHREMKVFLALLMLSGINEKPQQRLNWSTRPVLYTPIFGQSMACNRFEAIQTFLHLNDNSQQPDRNAPDADKLHKLRPLLNHIERKFAEIYYPGKNLSVDESMMPWQGRLQFKQYIPSKPCKYGIKMYLLCDAENGYVSRLKIYTGKEGNRPEKDHGANVVRKLSNDFHGKGHCIYMDNFFSSVPLFDELQAKGTSACGTVRSNRKGIPYDLRSRKLKRSESDFRRKEDLMCMKYHDKKEVYLLSTAHTAASVNTGKRDRRTQEPVIKPAVVHDYNAYMKGVDQFDQMLMYYSFNKKTMKWWKRAATHLIHLMKVESFIVHNINEPGKVTQLEFTLKLVEQLLDRTTLVHPLPPAADGQRFIGKNWHYLTPIAPTEKKAAPTRNCKVCTIPSGDKTPGAKRYIHRSESRYECVPCGGIALCVHPCHRIYHSIQDTKRAIMRHLGLNGSA